MLARKCELGFTRPRKFHEVEVDKTFIDAEGPKAIREIDQSLPEAEEKMLPRTI